MKHWLLAASLFAAGTFTLSAQAETLAYPGADNASFLIDHPADWEVEPGEEVGDFVTLSAPTGAVLQLRTVAGDDGAMDQVTTEGAEFLNETFTDVRLAEPKEIEAGGLSGSLVLGNGVDGEQQDVAFAMYYIALPDGNIAEIWYSVVKGDDAGGSAAVEILNSFRTP